MKTQQNQMKNQKRLNLYRILSKSVASIAKWLRANMNKHYRTLGLGLNGNIISICQRLISHSFILKVSFNPTRKSQYNSVYKDSMIGVFQKSQEIEKTRQEFVKVKCTRHSGNSEPWSPKIDRPSVIRPVHLDPNPNW